MRELKSLKLIYLKGSLLLIILLASFVLILFESESLWKRLILSILLIWSSARFYYFLFYVIEKYVDHNYKYSGIWLMFKHIIKKRNDYKAGGPKQSTTAK